MRVRFAAILLFLASPLLADDKNEGFVPLFNGRNLEGWSERQVKKGQEGSWTVADGILKAKAGSGWLGTAKEYGDFVLRVEWKIGVNGNSGVFFRVPSTEFKGSPSEAGFEIQILDDNGSEFKGKLKPYQYCGGLYHFLPVSKPVFKGAGEWQSYELTVKGDRISLVFNGTPVIDADIGQKEAMKKRPRKGFIGLQNHGTGVEFRKVEIKSLENVTADRPPNVVLIYADDLGYGDLGCYGGKNPTPNLDRMAREGIRFTDFYVAQAVCSASRTALLTGCYPNRLGILGALGPNSKIGISARETTIAEMLKKRGYTTAIFGKWHLGHHPQFLPTRHGFDEYFGLPYSNDMWPKHPTSKFPPLPLIDGEKTIAENPDQSKLTTWYTEHAVKFIEKSKDRPFFLYVPHAMPHVPLFVSERHAGKSGQGLYGDVLMEIDWSVGEILAALKKHGLDEQTLVIFTSDNGPWLSYGNHGGSSGPLREGKGTSWEGGVREPCVMRWPGKIAPGSVCRELAATIDILPTLAKLANAPLPELPIDGKNIAPLILGEPPARSPHEAYFYYWGRQLEAVRSGPWKLHLPHDYQTMIGQKAGKDGQPGKYVRQHTALALYDLSNDLGETKDVANEHPEVVARLEALAEKAREDLGDSAKKRDGHGVRLPGTIPN